MPDIQSIANVLSAPMEQVIVALGKGLAQAQRELDRLAIDTQREIDQDPQMAEHGLQATFYQIPRAELELTTAIALHEEQQPRVAKTKGAAAIPLAAAVALKQIHLQPVNAAYANQFDYNVSAASKLKVTIVPVPPPGAAGVVAPKLTRDEVIQIATPHLVSTAEARLAVNFNAVARLWFVLQYRLEGDVTRRLAAVVIDDDTRRTVKFEKEE